MGKRSPRGCSDVGVSGSQRLPACWCRCHSGWALVRDVLGRTGNPSGFSEQGFCWPGMGLLPTVFSKPYPCILKLSSLRPSCRVFRQLRGKEPLGAGRSSWVDIFLFLLWCPTALPGTDLHQKRNGKKKVFCANKIQTFSEQHLFVMAIRPDGPACSLVDYGSMDVSGGALSSLEACWSQI